MLVCLPDTLDIFADAAMLASDTFCRSHGLQEHIECQCNRLRYALLEVENSLVVVCTVETTAVGSNNSRQSFGKLLHEL